MIQVAKGNAMLVKKDIFKNIMWYVLPDSNKQYPMSIERVKKIKSLNQQGVIPEELEVVEITTGKPKEIEPEYVDLVGQISLQTLDKADRKKNPQRPQQNTNQQHRGRDQRPQQRQKGNHGNQGNQQRGGQQQNPNQQNPNQQNSNQQNPNQQRPNRPRPPFKKRDNPGDK
jgi:hypothetical protein